MFAVIKSGGKQYKVAENDIIQVEKLTAEAGSKVDLDTVLMIGEGADIDVGSPVLEGATVTAEVVEQARADKIIVFKKKRRQNYRRKKGHRQALTVLKILEISRDGAKKVAAKTEAPKEEVSEADAPEVDVKEAAPKTAAKKTAAKKTAAKKTATKKTATKKAATKKAAAKSTTKKKAATKKTAAKKTAAKASDDEEKS